MALRSTVFPNQLSGNRQPVTRMHVETHTANQPVITL